MKSISFKNFRRFAEFPEFKFGDITILVGGNNAGKSTLVKALLLVLDNLKTMRRDIDLGTTTNIFNVFYKPEFRFDENSFHELNIKNFSRAINRHCDVQNDSMSFTLSVEEPMTSDIYEFKIEVSRYKGSEDSDDIDPNEDARGLIDFISIRNVTKEILFEYCFKQEPGKPASMHIVLPDESSKEIAKKVESLQSRRKELVTLIETGEDLSSIADYKSELDKIDKVLKETLAEKKKAKDIEATIPMNLELDFMSKYLLVDLVYDFIRYSKWPSNEAKNSAKNKAETKLKDLIAHNQQRIEDLAKDIRSLLDSFNIDYIQAHGVTQKMLFSAEDQSDHIAKTIKDFMQSRAWKNQEIRVFIRDWMKEFKIGYDFRIVNETGEAFKVFILETPEDKTGFPLADLGMGSIQLMMLLFALATSIKRNMGSVFGKPTVIIEEPEQNLHPEVQSKLAYLLYRVNDKFGLKFIIETHSEYLVRSSQVIVSQQNKDIKDWYNPFKVYFFAKEGIPYDMKYQEDGCFVEEFGPGFFDEASKLAFKIF